MLADPLAASKDFLLAVRLVYRSVDETAAWWASTKVVGKGVLWAGQWDIEYNRKSDHRLPFELVCQKVASLVYATVGLRVVVWVAVLVDQ